MTHSTSTPAAQDEKPLLAPVIAAYVKTYNDAFNQMTVLWKQNRRQGDAEKLMNLHNRLKDLTEGRTATLTANDPELFNAVSWDLRRAGADKTLETTLLAAQKELADIVTGMAEGKYRLPGRPVTVKTSSAPVAEEAVKAAIRFFDRHEQALRDTRTHLNQAIIISGTIAGSNMEDLISALSKIRTAVKTGTPMRPLDEDICNHAVSDGEKTLADARTELGHLPNRPPLGPMDDAITAFKRDVCGPWNKHVARQKNTLNLAIVGLSQRGAAKTP